VQLKAGLLAVGIVALAATSAHAERKPSDTERATIEQMLTKEGFVSWGEIEWDGDGPVWEIDNARMADGRRFDLKISPGTLTVIKRDPEN
jgi:hypothetical protein